MRARQSAPSETTFVSPLYLFPIRTPASHLLTPITLSQRSLRPEMPPRLPPSQTLPLLVRTNTTRSLSPCATDFKHPSSTRPQCENLTSRVGNHNDDHVQLSSNIPRQSANSATHVRMQRMEVRAIAMCSCRQNVSPQFCHSVRIYDESGKS